MNIPIQLVDSEPRVSDIDIAERLGYAHPRQIRELIVRNADELETYASLSCGTTKPGPRGGRPATVYFLTEEQALCLCALARTPIASQVRKTLIEAYKAWREGKTVSVKAHKRRPPGRANPFKLEDMFYREHLSCLCSFPYEAEIMQSTVARLMARLDMLEGRRI